MSDKLIWSWTLEDTKDAIRRHELPKWVEKVIGVIGLFVLLFIIVKYISPITGDWFTYLIGVLVVTGIYLTLKNIKLIRSLDKEAYLKIYSDGMDINLAGYAGFYNLNKIVPGTLEIKTVFYSNSFGIYWIKGLCFKTISPTMSVKIPLIGIMGDRIEELKNIVGELKKEGNHGGNP